MFKTISKISQRTLILHKHKAFIHNNL